MRRARAAGFLRAAARAAYKHRRERAAACQQAQRCVCAHLRACNTDIHGKAARCAEIFLGALNVSCTAVGQFVGNRVDALHRPFDLAALAVSFQVCSFPRFQCRNDISRSVALAFGAHRVCKNVPLCLDILIPQGNFGVCFLASLQSAAGLRHTSKVDEPRAIGFRRALDGIADALRDRGGFYLLHVLFERFFALVVLRVLLL